MKSVQKVEKEILKLHDKYFDCYIRGDIKGMTPLLDESYTQVGSAESEVFSTKKGAVQFLKDTIHQVAGKVQMRNRNTRIEKLGNLYLVHDFSDTYVLDKKHWHFYAKFRLSTWFIKTRQGWKIVHQHGSFPDARTGEGDNIAIEKVSEENQKLHEAVKRRTKEIEDKNRELEIEAALERVRSVANSMRHSSEMPTVIKTIYEQMRELNPELDAADLMVLSEDKTNFTLWTYGYEGGLGPYVPSASIQKHPHHKATLKAWKNGLTERTSLLKGEPFMSYMTEAFQNSAFTHRIKKKIFSLAYVHHTETFFSRVCIRTASREKKSNAQIAIQKRFTRAFEQSYTRFLDLQKAEAQSREAHIEASLERVRSRSLAMHRSEELGELVSILFDELVKLDLVLARCIIWIINPKDFSSNVWIANKEDRKTPESYHVQMLEHNYYKTILKQWKKRNQKWVYPLKGAEKKSIDNLLLTKTELSRLPKAVKKGIAEKKLVMIAGSFNSFGFIEASGPAHHTPEQLEILSRFSRAFDQSYTRFLDLQKAEAQAREAQIEAALERVRSRSMAMHRSEELLEVINVVSEQLQHLNIKFGFVTFGNISRDGAFNFWMAAPGISMPEQIHVPYIDNAIPNSVLKAEKEGVRFFSNIFTKKETNDWMTLMFENNPKSHMLSVSKDFILNSSGLARSTVLMKDISVYIGNFIKKPLTDDENSIVIRFANVFEQSYTRFLDLQKAEAQAREAQIEAALERVRSRSMAMHKSEELREVIQLVFEQFRVLNFNIDSAQFDPNFKESDDFNLWTAVPGQPYSILQHIPYLDNAVFNSVKDAKKKGLSFIAQRFTREEKNEFFRHFFHHMHDIPSERKKFILESPGVFRALVFMDSIALAIQNYSAIPYTEEENTILGRFGKTFEQVYTRFLDLQKAEAQAKESQVQLALERVRARTMAMHKSAELSEVVKVLFEEFKKIHTDAATSTFARGSINIINEPNACFDLWITEVDGSEIQQLFKIVFDEPTTGIQLYESWKKKEPWLIVDLMGEELDRWLDYLIGTGFNVAPGVRGTRRVNNFIFFSRGYLGITSTEPLSEDSLQLLTRFAKVFEQTYTRFLDLQKAEAQAREAKIEAALEKVRSHSMAMQKSEDLKEVIQVVYDQLVHIGIKLDHAGFVVDYTPKGDWHFWIADKQEIPSKISHPYFDSIWANQFNEAKEKGLDFFATNLDFEEKNKFYTDLFRYVPSLSDESREFYFSCQGLAASNVLMDNVALYIENFSCTPYTGEENGVLKRFAKVFEQTYTRFLDLQKAEEQAREAQIEAALERVRSRTMAMHKSDELREAGELLWNELNKLGIASLSSGYVLIDEEKEIGWTYAPSPATGKIGEPLGIVHSETKEMSMVMASWKKSESLSVIEMDENETIVHQTFVAERAFGLDGKKVKWITVEQLLALSPKRLFLHNFNFKQGYLLIVGGERLKEAQIELMLRFTNVFQQTYTRFLDLQKAEAQAREAQIEAALERVRSRSMAMHKSEELNEVIQIVYEQFVRLNLNIEHTGFIIDYKERDDLKIWLADQFGSPTHVIYPYTDSSWGNRFKEAKERGIDFFTTLMNFEEKNQFLQELFKYAPGMPEEGKKIIFSKPGLAISTVLLDNVSLYIENLLGIPYSDEDNAILMRIGKVFQQTYTRFLDLQKAEAQAREAQIEAALEKIRSRSLAMHKSDELRDVIKNVLNQLNELGISMDTATISIPNRERTSVVAWVAAKNFEYSQSFFVPWMRDDQITKDLTDAYEYGMEYFCKSYSFEEKNKYYHNLFTRSDFKHIPEERKAFILSLPLCSVSVAGTKNSWIQVISYSGKMLSSEEGEVLKRFARVFEQCYIRFQDLEKAEAQAREAQIEAGLEKVRAKAMAMRTSADVSEAASMVFKELKNLGIQSLRSGVGLLKKDSLKAQVYATSLVDGHQSLALISEFDVTGNRSLDEQYQAWLRKENYFTVMKGEEMVDYYNTLNKNFKTSLGELKNREEEYGYYFYFSDGLMYSWSEQPYTEDELNILNRFKLIIDLTFRRYVELQQAEANTREAIKRATLDRVRAEIASMRTKQDLERITPLIWRELTTLGISFVRCGVFIMDEEKQIIHTFLSTPDGKAIAAFHLPYNSTTNLAGAIDGWRVHKRYVAHWLDKDFQSQADTLVQQGSIANREQYLNTIPKEGIYLHFLPFMQGMLYVGHTAPLNDDELNLIQSVADAFSTAYARYEDFNKLESAKKQVDNALTELKQAQQQLVQSEKMASLGELTAGIAHEIQNPLNFVNNFSEVSSELIDEMKTELASGNLQQVTEISNDLKQNLEKINHHGKRAGDIVKSMLQHSRKSGNQKELTDINALCDEYLRLAYHGYRAKDKSFNAEFKTEFDSTMPKLNIIPQDIGRVVLNLINNAFYAVNQQRTTNNEQPLVIVSTKNLGDRIEISVNDNGPGIPNSIKEKIFQPFFTTKPTGQGTGLGLSLSYDIVKAHGGELKVETKGGEGTEFIVSLTV